MHPFVKMHLHHPCFTCFISWSLRYILAPLAYVYSLVLRLFLCPVIAQSHWSFEGVPQVFVVRALPETFLISLLSSLILLLQSLTIISLNLFLTSLGLTVFRDYRGKNKSAAFQNLLLFQIPPKTLFTDALHHNEKSFNSSKNSGYYRHVLIVSFDFQCGVELTSWSFCCFPKAVTGFTRRFSMFDIVWIWIIITINNWELIVVESSH